MKIPMIKKVVLSMAVISLLYLAYSMGFMDKDRAFASLLARKASFVEASVEHKGLHLKQEKDYLAFLKEVEEKNIFSLPKIKEARGRPKVDRSQLERVIRNLRLVGILKNDSLKAIIEDTAKNNTFFLAENDSFLDDITLEKIGKDRVTLFYKGERFELGF